MVSRIVGTIAVGVLVVAGLADYASAFAKPIYTKSSVIKPTRLYKIEAWPTKFFPLPADNLSLTGGSLTVTVNSGVDPVS